MRSAKESENEIAETVAGEGEARLLRWFMFRVCGVGVYWGGSIKQRKGNLLSIFHGCFLKSVFHATKNKESLHARYFLQKEFICIFFFSFFDKYSSFADNLHYLNKALSTRLW